MAVNTKIQVRRGTASQWTSTNPALAAGEIGFETDTGKFKFGKDGIITWNSIPYAGGSAINNGSGVCIVYDSGNNAYTISSEFFTSGSGLSLSNTACGSGNGNAYTLSLNNRLQEVSKLATSGLVVSTSASGVTTRSIASGNSNIVVTNGDGTAGNPTISLASDLTGLNSLNVDTINATNFSIGAITVQNNITATGFIKSLSYVSGVTVYGQTGVFTGALTLNGTGVSLSGHTHTYSDITNFCSGVATCVNTAITAESGVQTVYNSGNSTLYIRLSGEALAQHNITDTGIIVRTGTTSYAGRTITGGNGVAVTNGNGVAGNPTVALSGDVTGLTGLTVGNIRISGNSIISTDTNGNITLGPNGTGDVYLDADTVRVGDANTQATLTTNGTGNLVINTNNGSNSSSVTINQGTNGNIDVGLNGTGSFNVGKVNISGAAGSVINNTSIGYTTASSGKFTLVEVDNTKIDNDIIYYTGVARLDLGATETVINNSGANVNFRVEGNTNQNLLFVDATNNRVGIGTSSPSALLSVSGAAAFSSTITASSLGADTASNSAIVLDSSNNLKTRTLDGRIWSSGLLVAGTGSAGHIPYWDTANSISYDNAKLYWDATNDRLGIGTSSPGHTLDVSGSGNITGNLIIGGNLTVNGTTVTANVTTMEVKDSIITLGLASGNVVTDTSFDRGLTLVRGTGLNAFMGWDTSATEFIMLSSGTETGSIYTGTYGALRVGSVVATGSITANTFSGNGSSLTNLNASNISTGTLGSGYLPTVTVTSGTAGPTNNFVSSITVDTYGRVLAVNNTTHTVATTGVLGIASFSNTNFDVTAGAVTIKTSGVSNTNLANSTITLGTTVMALGASSGTITGLTGISGTSAGSPTTLTYCVIDGGTP